MTPKYSLTRRDILRLSAVGLTASPGLAQLTTPAAAATSAPDILWEREFPQEVSSYTLGANNLFIGGEDGLVEARHLKTGVLLQKFDLNSSVEEMAISEAYFLFTTSSDRLHVINRQTLKEEWRIPTGGEVSGLYIHNDNVIIAADESITMRSLSDGEVKWRTNMSAERATFGDGKLFFRAIDIADGNFGGDTSVYALNVDTGEVAWKIESEAEPSVYDNDQPVDISYSNGRVFASYPSYEFSEYEGTIALDSNNGSLIWNSGYRPEPGYVTNSDVVVDESVDPLSASTGQTLFESNIEAVRNGLALTNDSLFVLGKDKDGIAISSIVPTTGIIEWESRLEHKSWIEFVDLQAGREIITYLSVKEYEYDKVSVRGPLSGDREALSGTRIGADIPDSPSIDPSESREATDQANFNLTASETTVTLGGSTRLQLSAINEVDEEPMTLQLLLEVPSGVDVTNVKDADEGSNQFTAVSEVSPGSEDNIGLNIQVNELGTHVVRAKAVFYYGDKKGESESVELKATVKGTNKTPTSSSSTSGSGSESGNSGVSDSLGPSESSDGGLLDGFIQWLLSITR
ncbi:MULTISPECIES: PQQ-binding-like beta-propeller repeat protein [Haloferax]|nr:MULTISPECIES: PQQ-binding-like beta-propeller repeat protein [Haloferax]